MTMKLTAFVGYDGSLDEENFGFTVHKTLTEAQAAFEVDQGNEDVEASVEGQTCMFAIGARDAVRGHRRVRSARVAARASRGGDRGRALAVVF